MTRDNFSQYKLIFLISIFFTAFYNFSFFENVINIYNLKGFGIIHFISLIIVQIAFTTLFFTIFASKITTKPMLILTLFISSFSAYFMDTETAEYFKKLS